MNVTRLDCYWPYCNQPSSLSASYILLDGGDACREDAFQNLTSDLDKHFLLVEASSCTYEYAVEKVANTSAKGTIGHHIVI
jgi:hypothetical protein